MVDDHDDDNVNSHKSTAQVDAVGEEESPSVSTGGNNEWENPGNDDAPTQHEHCVGVLVGCDNDSSYIPTSGEVYDSIDQDRLFADNGDDSTIEGDLPVFLGMVVAEDSDDDSSSNKIFDKTNDVNIMLHALYRAAHA